MAIIRQTNKKTGITYVIESESYWDKEKKQPRSHRRIIGKIDPVTGEVVPTHQKKNSEPAVKETSRSPATLPVDASDLNKEIRLRDARILELEQQVARLQEEKETILRELTLLSAKFST
ncbi:MAG: hypothetical protein Q4D81_09030 [Eubacteriales bacterium]|nr:hypothetical protein [Eubacteriales bacterium]